MGFETENQEPTRMGSGWRARNPRPTVRVVRSGGGGYDTGGLAGLSGLRGRLESPNFNILETSIVKEVNNSG